MKKTFFIFFAYTFLVNSTVANAQDATPTPESKRSWTAAEILEVRQKEVKKRIKYCQGGRFKPCVCASDVTKLVQYRPSVTECGGRAGVVKSGRYMSAFSVVVRDRDNRDRWPVNGANGCTPYETNVLALNKCSVFKVQKIIKLSDPKGDAELHCLGASGYSRLFKNVTRMTIKLADIPNSTKDPLARLCLSGPTKPLN